MSLIKCPECGKEISDKAAYCVNCGYSLAWDEQKPRRVNKTIIVIITIIIVAALCVSGVMIYKHYSNDDIVETDIKNQQVEDVINAIAKLEEITINDRTEIDRINAMYSSLSDEDKKLVTNYDKLMSANNKMAMLNVGNSKEKTTEKQTEQKNDINLDSTYKNLNDKLKQADDTYTSFLNNLQYSSDQVRVYNNNLSKLNNTKQLLDQAYNICGDHKELQSVKKKIQTAKNSLPTSRVKDTDDLLGQLDKHEQFSYDLYNARLEVAEYLDSR